jgi:hypothetical protein
MGGTNWPIECGLGGAPFLPGPSGPIDFRGWHASGIGPGSSGYDQFWLQSPLQNSWVFTDLGPPYSEGSSGGSQATFSVNASNATAPVVGANWRADACNLIAYGGDMYIEGPIGVPY